MKGRDKLFFNLLLFLFVVVIGLITWRTMNTQKEIKRWLADMKRRQERGVEDPVLRETVDRMEAELRARLTETFALERDPLDLTEVIKTRTFLKKLGQLERAEADLKMRLSCTVTGEKGPSAIVKWLGRSWVVGIGDYLGEGDKRYRVESIGSNRMVVARGGERLNLVTEKAPDTKAQEEMMYGSGGVPLPVIEVKQVPAGNY
ncbi:MAG: hypothetical protein FJY65_08000 [Calditrichaeota bacterium]|nr:hypothetical protein [Calditrichota bacterium]